MPWCEVGEGEVAQRVLRAGHGHRRGPGHRVRGRRARRAARVPRRRSRSELLVRQGREIGRRARSASRSRARPARRPRCASAAAPCWCSRAKSSYRRSRRLRPRPRRARTRSRPIQSDVHRGRDDLLARHLGMIAPPDREPGQARAHHLGGHLERLRSTAPVIASAPGSRPRIAPSAIAWPAPGPGGGSPRLSGSPVVSVKNIRGT